jgi:SAM-dependent methyltransferase
VAELLSHLVQQESSSVLTELGIVPGHGLLDSHRDQIRRAGFDLDEIIDLSDERVHDAAFLTEEIARATLGRNHERIVASIRNCSETISELNPSRVVDLGGGCGVICFDPARNFPTTKFVVCDRSANALRIGRRWAERLKLENVFFVRADFSEPSAPDVIGRDADLVLLEYVFDLGFEREHEEDVISSVSPALRAAATLVRPRGKVQVRFGEFSEPGINGLVRAAYRAGLFICDVSFAIDGCTFQFSKTACERSEDAEVFSAMDWFSAQVRAADPGD